MSASSSLNRPVTIPGLLLVLASCWLLPGQAQAEVSLNGIEPGQRDNILAYMRLDDETCDAPDWRVRRLFAEAEKEIRAALEVVGYYNVSINKQLQQNKTY